MNSQIQSRFGKTRGTPEHYFRVQVSLDGGRSYADALVMKRDDRDGPDRNSTPYRVEWAATKDLERKANAALGGLEKRYSAKHNKAELKKFLRDVPRRYFPPDAEVRLELAVRIAKAPFRFERQYGPLEPWEREADDTALRRAGIADRVGDEGDVRMPELFRWVPWFEELAEAVGEGGREGLVERAKKVDWAGKCVVLDRGEENADPLTFFYHLASIAGGTVERRKKVYASVADVFRIKSDLDYSVDDSFFFPIPDPRFVVFKNGDDPRVFWDTFDWARPLKSTSYDTKRTDTFARTLQVKGVGVAKLTQVLFLINPRAFLPFDERAILPLGIGGFTKPPTELSWAEYVAEMDRIRTVFPGCQPYELNIIGYQWTSGEFPREGNRWYQISASHDEWRDFRDNHRVHRDGQGDMDRPEPGDIILVRSGTRVGRGIGIVYRNDYGEASRTKRRIHMLWVNKRQAALAADMPSSRFSTVEYAAYTAFATSNAYRETLKMLTPPSVKNTNTNTLYAKFYKALVAQLRTDGVHPVGSGGLRGRWRSFQTGYPDAVYVTGLDDGKAKVFVSFGGPSKEQRFHALLTRREEIDGKLKGNVSWLDETQPDGEDAGLLLDAVRLEMDAPSSLTGPEEGLEATRRWMRKSLLLMRDAVLPHLDQVTGLDPSPRTFSSLTQSLRNHGLLFPRELVANYILALQTKRFAILTGISGTGKTKIAMAVARQFEHSGQRDVAKIPDEAVGVEVKATHFRQLVLPVDISRSLSIGATRGPGSGPEVWVRYPGGRFRLRTYVTGGQHLMLLFKGDFKEWFKSTFDEGDHFWLRVREGETPESDELEFGLPDTEIVEAPLDNHVVVPVRPDWVDNRGLLGYFNPLTKAYSTTPFLNLLLRARDEERRAEAAGEKPHPFFVILDEMNLARVEHYFSDFLSALESGEDIPLHEDEAVESGESESGPQVPRTLKVPGNVLFTGTVNVDETTYMFSPKVLDRAFTIEFDRVDLKGFAKSTSSEDASGLNLDGIEGSLDLLRSGRSKDGDWKPSREDWVKFSKETGRHPEALLRLHDILEVEHRHFGYRVANEIARFVNLAREQAKDANAAVDAAFDLALLQKVLPKFHGTQQELESLLEEIFQFAVYRDKHVPKNDRTVKLDDWKVVKGRLVGVSKSKTPSKASSGDGSTASAEADSADAKGADAGPESPAYPRTGAKVLRMLKRLRDRGFTSFIE